jgi:POT family proton-dependent oligopeptide transporter
MTMNKSTALTCPQENINTDLITKMLMLVKMLLVLPFGVLSSSLVLYLTHALNLSDFTAITVTACFLGSTGLLRIAAGWIADNYISNHHLLLLSSLFMFAGSLLTAIPALAYWGIACIALGSAFTIAVNCLLSNLFQQDDIKRESVFLHNYSVMNIGYIASFMISGYFELQHQYQNLFLLASGISFLSLLMVISIWRILPSLARAHSNLSSFSNFSDHSNKPYRNLIGALLIFIMYLYLYGLLTIASIDKHYLQIFSMLVAISILIYSINSLNSIEKVSSQPRNTFFTYFIFIIPVLIFSTIQNLSPMILTLFIERNVDRYYFSQVIPPQWISLFSTAAIIVGGPSLCYLFNQLRKIGININTTLQFAISLMLMGASLLVITIGICLTDKNSLVNCNWIIISNLLQGFSELLIVPIGFGLIAKIAPRHLHGTMMGIWLLLLSMGAIFAGLISTLITDLSFSCFLLGSISMLFSFVIFRCRFNKI